MLGLLRRRIVRPRFAPRVSLAGKIVLVTGAGPGSIGFETARALAEWGAEVIVTRRRGAAELAAELAREAGGSVRGVDLDVADAASVNAFARGLRETSPQLDVLVNNAGIHLDLMSEWDAPRLSPDGFEVQWRTNHLGASHLLFALLPLLRRAAKERGEARVVNVVSELHKRARNDDLIELREPYDSWVAYGASKLAQVHMAFELERRFGAEGVHGYCLHPGAVYTNVASKGLEGHARVEKLRAALAPLERYLLMTPREGAQTSVFCATAPGLPGGRYYRRCAPARVSEEARDHRAASRLWEETERWARGATTAPE